MAKETTVFVPDDNTIILGVLVKLNESKGGSKIPLLGDIPLIGALIIYHLQSRWFEEGPQKGSLGQIRLIFFTIMLFLFLYIFTNKRVIQTDSTNTIRP